MTASPPGPADTGGRRPHAGEALAVVGYDPRWPALYDAERRRIQAALGRRLASIEHVGSSSVRGLGGRREIDILIGVRSMAKAGGCVSALRRLGYVEPPGREQYARDWRFLTRRGPVVFEVLIVNDGGPYWHHVVRFRDYLRRHPEAARQYHRLKLEASLKAAKGDASDYVDQKRRFQASVLGSDADHSHRMVRAASSVPARAPLGGTAPLDLVHLTPLMDRTQGAREVRIGLIDGPVASSHPDLAEAVLQEVGMQQVSCRVPAGAACSHGTFVAGVLSARRGSAAPAICPGCTLLTRPIFTDNGRLPTATPAELAQAILDCLEAGARVVNVSAALLHPSSSEGRKLEDALTQAQRAGAVVVTAAGNQALVGGTALTRHPSVVPVVAYDLRRRPMSVSNAGHSVGRHGLGGPGEGVVSLTPAGSVSTSGGTSVSAAFVTGTLALLWSEFPGASGQDIRMAALHGSGMQRRSVFPPLLDAWAAWQWLSKTRPHSQGAAR